MAHKKAGGSTKLGRDSQSKRLGIKLFGRQTCKSGNIIVRQKGTHYYPGKNVVLGKDFTITAKIDGVVQFQKKMLPKFNGQLKKSTIVNVVPKPKKEKK
jgi:large subunit ribosomal protein L27